MSPVGRSRSRLSLLGVVIALATIGGGGYGVYRAVSGGGASGLPSTTVANEFVSLAAAGSSPRRLSTPSSFADPAGCNSTCAYGSLSAAYVAASCGDSALIHTVSATNQLIAYTVAKSCPDTAGCRDQLTYGDGTTSTQDYASCVTFQYEQGVSGAIGGTSSAGGAAAIGIEVPYVRLGNLSTQLPTSGAQNPIIRIGSNVGRVAGPCSQWNVHDVIVTGITTAAFIMSGSYNTVENSNLGPEYASTSTPNFVNTCNNGDGVQVKTDHPALVHSVIHDYIQDVSNAAGHSEGIHWQGGDDGLISRNIFKNVTQQDISVQTNCGTGAATCSVDNLLIENNVFDQACSDPSQPAFCATTGVSGGGTTFICDNTGDEVKNITVQFNSYDAGLGAGTPSLQNTLSGGGIACDNTKFGPFTFTGNIIRNCPTVSTITTTYTYNISFSATCAGTGNTVNANAAAIYTAPSYSSYDWTELTGSPSINFLVGSGVTCPLVSLTGVTRPSGAGCDAGAYER